MLMVGSFDSIMPDLGGPPFDNIAHIGFESVPVSSMHATRT